MVPITLTAHAEPGYEFIGWGIDCAPCGTAVSCQVVMDRDRICTAVFRPGPLIPDLRINGSDGPLTLNRNDFLNFQVSLDPGAAAGVPGDYFLWAEIPGACYCYAYPDTWNPCPCVAPVPAYQGALVSLENFPVFETLCTGLTAGPYALHFVVDRQADGILGPEYTDDEVRFEILPY